ncbi:transport-associated ob type 1 [Desulfoluna butyratoxydans]|uniref:Transport-associated ob type 1 n=2 Tax=Desulfoluna butyratoxydans TaxID=231438 RepID=A0A4U8YXH3_9BACT|nr:transport-associated ob type 1 [Desulfoluna butyratoxydans]
MPSMKTPPHASANPSTILTPSEEERTLDPVQLAALETAFRDWVSAARRSDVRRSRQRIFCIFLLIRYTGARLGEILGIASTDQIDFTGHTVHIGSRSAGYRDVQIPPHVAEGILEVLPPSTEAPFSVDPGHVRRKFYEQAESCGLAKAMGSPNVIRRSRALELLRSNLPLPVVQKMLGHSTAGLTASWLDFSEQDMQRVVAHVTRRESRIKTSARNSFAGKVASMVSGEIQTVVTLDTLGGYPITAIITNESADRLALKPGTLLTAEVKAPWVLVAAGPHPPLTSCANTLEGKVRRIIKGGNTTEVILGLKDGTEVCALMTRSGDDDLGLRQDDTAWALIDAFSVILRMGDL